MPADGLGHRVFGGGEHAGANVSFGSLLAGIREGGRLEVQLRREALPRRDRGGQRRRDMLIFEPKRPDPLRDRGRSRPLGRELGARAGFAQPQRGGALGLGPRLPETEQSLGEDLPLLSDLPLDLLVLLCEVR